MKTIENKAIDFADVKNYAGLLRACVSVPQQGIDLDIMRKRLRVLDALEKAEDTIEVEDVDLKTIQDCVRGMKWNVVHRDIMAFADYILALA